MPNPVFPTLSIGQDSSQYELEIEDPSMKSEMEGGYVVSRAKHTRAPRKTFKSGFTDLSGDDKATLTAFYETVRGGSVIFDWTDPASLTVYQVRFMEKLNFKYVGMGNTQRWNVGFSLQQA